jgi:hypothetical protein
MAYRRKAKLVLLAHNLRQQFKREKPPSGGSSFGPHQLSDFRNWHENGHPSPPAGRLLLGVKRKSAAATSTSEFDPEQTLAD